MWHAVRNEKKKSLSLEARVKELEEGELQVKGWQQKMNSWQQKKEALQQIVSTQKDELYPKGINLLRRPKP